MSARRCHALRTSSSLVSSACAMVRTCAEKVKMTFEAVQHKDRGEMLAQFLHAITDHMKEHGTSMSAVGVIFPRLLQFGLRSIFATAKPSEDQEPKAAKLLSIDEVDDKVYIAKCKGFQVNMMVYEKSVGGWQRHQQDAGDLAHVVVCLEVGCG